MQGGLWDPDAGLVIPRSQTVAGKLVDQGEAAGKLQAFANTPAKSLIIENGRIKGVVTDRGTIMADYVVVCAGIWGRLIAEMAGEDLPVMPVDHPLTFFGPYNEFAGTGKEIGWPLLRDQGNSAYMRDTGDPKTAEGGQIEWGYYEADQSAPLPSARPSRKARGAPVALAARPRHGADHRAARTRHGTDADPRRTRLQRKPFLQRPAAGDGRRRPVDAARARRCAGLWYAVAIWVKDGPGMGKLIADWMTDGRTEIDQQRSTMRASIRTRWKRSSSRAAAARPRRRSTIRPSIRANPMPTGRNVRRSPFWEREKELGGYFMELGGWERAHGYAANEHLLEKYGDRVPVRENEWDNRHFWRVSNAEHLAHERGLRHRQPVAFRHRRRRRPGPCRADGVAVRRQDRRRRQYRQGHLHPLPRRRGHGARRLDRHPHGRPLPRDRRGRCRPARLPLHAPRG